jgi:hypothetical protein
MNDAAEGRAPTLGTDAIFVRLPDNATPEAVAAETSIALQHLLPALGFNVAREAQARARALPRALSLHCHRARWAAEHCTRSLLKHRPAAVAVALPSFAPRHRSSPPPSRAWPARAR